MVDSINQETNICNMIYLSLYILSACYDLL